MDNETRHALRQQQATIANIVKQMGDAATRQQQAQADANARKVVDVLTEVQGKLIDRSAAYANLMLLAGYAGFFALWSGTRNALPVKANISIAGLASASLVIFILFEIYKMVMTARRFFNNRTVLTGALPLDQLVKKLEELKRDEAKLPVGYMGIWISALVSCIAFALLAFGLLAYNFFAILIGLGPWPT